MPKIKPIHLFLVGFLLLLLSCQKNEPIPPNKVPVVNAGLPQTTTLPADSVFLIGSAADADGQIVSYFWSQLSGPAFSLIVNPGSSSTKIKGLKQGTYIFQLMANDNGGSIGVDTVAVLVNPSPITTFTVQPANNPNEIALVNNNGVDESGGSRPDMPIEAWTNGGNPYTVRGIIKFDLSSIPSTATIVSANLYLYSYPSPTLNGNFTDANFGTNNTLLVQQVTSDWTPATATWFNQPATTTTNEIIVPHTAQSILDLNFDVTNMLSTMVNNSANYGFFLMLQNETIYNSRIFVASYNTTHITKHPKLVVVYQ
ncbi:MAG: DNRLRE domain-containing protein [Bacteroidota bacterium]|nr:DNRLRE domain-containing protein [Bacteroidota bacterium]